MSGIRIARRFAPWLLAITLLLGQLGVFVHAFEHVHEHESDAADTVCVLCVAQAGLGSALPPGTLTVPAISTAPVSAQSPKAHSHCTVPRTAHARAPPLFSVA